MLRAVDNRTLLNQIEVERKSGSRVRAMAHLNDDKAVVKMGAPIWGDSVRCRPPLRANVGNPPSRCWRLQKRITQGIVVSRVIRPLVTRGVEFIQLQSEASLFSPLPQKTKAVLEKEHYRSDRYDDRTDEL